jgi:hypothetical protein
MISAGRWQVAPSLEQQDLLASVVELRKEVKAARTEAADSSSEMLTIRQRHERLRELCTCPITQEVMSDPVIASDGHCYERAAIARCIHAGAPSPLTRQQLEPSLVQSHAHKALCRVFT